LRSAEEAIGWAISEFGNGVVLATSMQKGGIVVLDLALKVSPGLRVVTVDTGRLPEETFEMIEAVRQRYGISIETISPAADEVGRMVERFGPNLFYRDASSRLLCCEVRKVKPFERAVKGAKAILTGLRRDQSESRNLVEQIDGNSAPVKVNPLAYWSAADVNEYTELHRLPVHPLYAKGYASIGCGPCTRAIDVGADVRSGRWWWESGSEKECGIHFGPNGAVRRNVDVMLDEIAHHG
jgi:phosphoadenylyl-sulfate reductase (thioredoxin)